MAKKQSNFYLHIAYKACDDKGNTLEADCCVCIPKGAKYGITELRAQADQHLKSMVPSVSWNPATLTSISEISEELFYQLVPEAKPQAK